MAADYQAIAWAMGKFLREKFLTADGHEWQLKKGCDIGQGQQSLG